MRVRTRLLLAFAYILLTVVIALEIPFAVNLNRRAEREEENRVLTLAQGVADGLELSELLREREGDRLISELQEFVEDERTDLGGARLIILDSDGELLADSEGTEGEGTEGEGTSYASRPEVSAILEREEAFATDRRFSEDLGIDILAAAAAVHGPGTIDGIARISTDLEGVRQEVRRILIATAFIGLVGLAAGLALAWILAGQLSRPLARLARAARRLGEGDLASRSGVEGGGEIGEVARTFDSMAERLQRTVTAQREFVANASHQLRTPLTGIKLRLESAREDAPTEDLRRQLRAAEQETDRLAGIVERLLVMARSVESGETPTASDLERVGRKACDRWSDRAEKAGGSLELELVGDGGAALAAAAEDDLNQILDNLIDNALSYAPGPVRMEVGRREGRALVAVEDRGPGIPEAERARVLERFYRGRGTAPGGSGLGLAIVRDLAGRWDGEVAVLAAKSGGTRIEVSFPAAGPT